MADRTESRDYNVTVEGTSMELRPSNFGSSGAQPSDTKNTSPVVPVLETRKVEQVMNGRDGGTPAPKQQAVFHGRLIIFALVYHVHDACSIFQEWANQMVYLRHDRGFSETWAICFLCAHIVLFLAGPFLILSDPYRVCAIVLGGSLYTISFLQTLQLDLCPSKPLFSGFASMFVYLWYTCVFTLVDPRLLAHNQYCQQFLTISYPAFASLFFVYPATRTGFSLAWSPFLHIVLGISMAVTAAYRARRASILLMSVYCVANLLLGGWPPLLDVSALHTGLHLFCETLVLGAASHLQLSLSRVAEEADVVGHELT